MKKIIALHDVIEKAKRLYKISQELFRSFRNMKVGFLPKGYVLIFDKSSFPHKTKLCIQSVWDGFRGEKINPQLSIWIVPVGSFCTSYYEYRYRLVYNNERVKVEYRIGRKKEAVELNKGQEYVIQDGCELTLVWFDSKEEVLTWLQATFFM